MRLVPPPGGYAGESRQPWILTPSGVLVPGHELLGRTRVAHADIVLKYWKVQMSAADLLGRKASPEPDGFSRVTPSPRRWKFFRRPH